MFNGGPGNDSQFGWVLSLKCTHEDTGQNKNYKIRRDPITYNVGLYSF